MSWANLSAERRAELERTLTPLMLEVIKGRLNGHSYEQIGLAMNLDEATIRGHHKRAIRRLNNARKEHAA